MTRPNDESRGGIVLYQTADGTVELDVRLEQETIWLNQKQSALLFDKDTDTIDLQTRNAYREGELEESATTEESSVVQEEGNRAARRLLPVRAAKRRGASKRSGRCDADLRRPRPLPEPGREGCAPVV